MLLLQSASASADYGTPFYDIFKQHNWDFYKIDPLLFSPAEVYFCNLRTGRGHPFGRAKPQVLCRAFFGWSRRMPSSSSRTIERFRRRRGLFCWAAAGAFLPA